MYQKAYYSGFLAQCNKTTTMTDESLLPGIAKTVHFPKLAGLYLNNKMKPANTGIKTVN